MSYEKTGRRSDKFSKNTKISQAFKIQPAVGKKSYGALSKKRYSRFHVYEGHPPIDLSPPP
jgi:hypothetical protein